MDSLDRFKSSKSVILDVGGKHFRTTTQTLKTLPRTRLGKAAAEAEKKQQETVELFYDRNPKIVHCLIDLYRTGELHLPENMCAATVSSELEFWEVPMQLIKECCWKRIESNCGEQEVVEEIDRFLQDPYSELVSGGALTWRTKLWLTVEYPQYSVPAKIWNALSILCIFLSIFSFVFETIKKYRRAVDTFTDLAQSNITAAEMESQLSTVSYIVFTLPQTWLLILRYTTFTFFVSDFMLRLCACPDKKRFFGHLQNWLELFVAVQSLVHFLVEKQMVATEAHHTTETERTVLIAFFALSGLRAFRIFYLAKYIETMKVLLLCAKSSMRELMMLIVCVLTFVILFGTVVYFTEILSGCRTFSSVPVGMWWAVITMTTVGYGDVYPVSAGGKFVGSLCALCGVIVTALPIAVIVSKFSTYHDNMSPREQSKKREDFLKANPEYTFHESAHAGKDRCDQVEVEKRNLRHVSRNQVDIVRMPGEVEEFS